MFRTLVTALASAALAAAVTTFVLRPEARAQEPAGDGTSKMAATIARYLRAATPNEHHRRLCEDAGKWDFEATTFLGPKQETTPGKAEFEAALGGRYVVQRTQGQLLGGDFDGLGINGYDNVAKEYFTVWIDSWSTGIYVVTGKPPAEGEPLVLAGEARDALSPNGRPWRMVRHAVSKDEFRIEMFDTLPGADGPTDTKVAELRYVRSR